MMKRRLLARTGIATARFAISVKAAYSRLLLLEKIARIFTHGTAEGTHLSKAAAAAAAASSSSARQLE
jgi:hypothetical protein